MLPAVSHLGFGHPSSFFPLRRGDERYLNRLDSDPFTKLVGSFVVVKTLTEIPQEILHLYQFAAVDVIQTKKFDESVFRRPIRTRHPTFPFRLHIYVYTVDIHFRFGNFPFQIEVHTMCVKLVQFLIRCFPFTANRRKPQWFVVRCRC